MRAHWYTHLIDNTCLADCLEDEMVTLSRCALPPPPPPLAGCFEPVCEIRWMWHTHTHTHTHTQSCRLRPSSMISTARRTRLNGEDCWCRHSTRWDSCQSHFIHDRCFIQRDLSQITCSWESNPWPCRCQCFDLYCLSLSSADTDNKLLSKCRYNAWNTHEKETLLWLTTLNLWHRWNINIMTQRVEIMT